MTAFAAMRRLRRSMRFARFNRRDVFEHIYKTRYWGDQESVSGPGSSWSETKAVREHLPVIVRSFAVKSIFDAPCGDLHWMARLIPQLDIEYRGGDVAPGVVALARSCVPHNPESIALFDIVSDAFPSADLWLCRDALFHLPNRTVLDVFANFARSGIPYVLLTTHTNPGVRNRDIVAGDFREMDVFAPPFNLRRGDALYRFQECGPAACPRDMVLLRREAFSA